MLHRGLPLFALALNVLLLGSALAGDRKHNRNYVYAYVALALSIWNLGVFGLRWTDDRAVAMTWERLVHVGVVPIPVLFYHYVLVFLDLPRRTSTLVLGYALTAFFGVLIPSALFMPDVIASEWGFMPKSGPLYAPFFVYFYAYLTLGLVQLFRSYRAMTSSFRRNRTRLVIIGTCFAISGGVVDFLRFILGLEWLYPTGIPANAVFAVALGIAVVRYRLWDVRIIAKRLVLYGLMSLSLVPVVIGTLYVLDRFTPADDFTPHLPFAFALLGVVVITLPFLRNLETSAERFMLARQHGVRDALGALSKEMASILDLRSLGQQLTEGLVQRVPVLHASLHLRDEAASERFTCFSQALSPALEAGLTEPSLDPRLILWLRLTGKPIAIEEVALQAFHDRTMQTLAADLEAARVAVLVPLFMDGELTAVLTVGEKVSGEIFMPEEIALLDALVGQTAIALKNARLYEDLRRQMDELRTTQQQLIQAAKLAAIGELAAGVAHELNSPLTVIAARCDLLVRKVTADSPAVPAVESIKAEALRAARITRGLLDFARKREPKHEPVNVNWLVPRAIDLVQTKLHGREIEVETVLDSALPSMLGDGDQLTQVLINLIGNAADAMPRGGRVTITTGTRTDMDSVAMSVSDTGTGMTPEQLARIFEPFYTTKAEGKGTGLGLSVTLGIVKSHQGTIAVDSEPGRGTTMTVQLPLSSERSPAPVAIG